MWIELQIANWVSNVCVFSQIVYGCCQSRQRKTRVKCQQNNIKYDCCQQNTHIVDRYTEWGDCLSSLDRKQLLIFIHSCTHSCWYLSSFVVFFFNFCCCWCFCFRCYFIFYRNDKTLNLNDLHHFMNWCLLSPCYFILPFWIR